MAAASTCSEITNDGPAINLINKRHRALRKKLNRIAQMEDSLSQGKSLNKEQEETLRSKPSVIAAIDELEKLREPLLQAVEQEIKLALEKNKQNPPKEEEVVAAEAKPAAVVDDGAVSDLLNLLYFGSVFDVKTLMMAHDKILTRTHERNCCLTYDYVTDDEAAGDPLKEWDLDLIAMLGGLLISRPFNSSLSHKNSLKQCVEHAKLWLANSDQPIEPNSDITYAGLRERLNKILASDYFTTSPEIKAPVDVAAAGGNYTSYQVSLQESVILPVEGSGVEYHQEAMQEGQSPNTQASVVENGHVEEHNQGENSVEILTQAELANGETRDVDSKEQYASRKVYMNHRGGRGGGARRGNGNGRGGRGGNRGGGGYQNGRGQVYEQSGGGYYPRNNYRARGGRGVGGNNGNYPGPAGHAQEAS